ncbi:hypothetical protein O181_044731 [Austropuccinia psidii MF-1]|uniref:DNA repair protein rhp7 treble clef domain-containing protein n=1 Tax=Austropuccinia psidii MF-1 TaxID=1389203 RepID=A0A9Q3HH47_9BASI|nr:hypothetical protein [Austropuccinia psidii MF-1]
MVRPSRFNNPSTSHSTSQQSSSHSNSVGGVTVVGVSSQASGDNQTNASAPPPPPPAGSTISGPTSALTSFLKEQGIRPRNVSRFTSIQSQASTSVAILEEPAEQDNVNQDDEDVDSDNLDDDQPMVKPGKRSQKTKATHLWPGPGASSSKVPATKKTSPEPPSKPKPGKYADRKPGHIATCAECGKRFTVTRYTQHAQGEGQLCDACAQENSCRKAPEDGNARPSAKKRRTKKNPAIKPTWSENSIQTLQMACITVIARHTESIDRLENVGSVNLEKICQIVCKHRELKPVNLPLFLDVSHSELKLFDCIHLRQETLMSIPVFCPRLVRLMLNFCGHMTGEVLVNYAQRLSRLRELDLFGPYLVRKEEWLEVFKIWNTVRPARISTKNEDEEDAMRVDADPRKSIELLQGPQISAFRLKQSPRFDFDCVKALMDCCKNLTNLRLDDIGLLDDRALDVISAAGLNQLRNLAIANGGITNGATGEVLTDGALIRLLKSVAGSLEVLDISQNKKLTDAVLCDGIGAHCRKLHTLDISGLGEVTTQGVERLFEQLRQAGAPAIVHLRLARCIKVGNDGLSAILSHSAPSLKALDINSVDELRAELLERLAKEAIMVEELDVSFVRDVDDFVIKAFLDGMPKLKNLFTYGNNRVSDLCPSRKGVVIKGQERAILVN